MSPIASVRRELQNAIGEIEIGDFLFFDVFLWFWASLMVQEEYLMLPDAPISVWIDDRSIQDRCWIDAGSILDRSWIDPGLMLDRSWIDAGSILDRS